MADSGEGLRTRSFSVLCAYTVSGFLSPLLTRPTGAALFADISGFTPLTEALTHALGPRRGAKALTQQINAVYEALLDAVESHAGSVVGFAGDAVTCWFDDTRTPDSGTCRAVACARAMQAIIVQVQPTNRDLATAIGHISSVRAVEGVGHISARVRVGTTWRALALSGVDDVTRMQVNQLLPDSGAWPMPRRSMLIERSYIDSAGTQIGDSVSIKLEDNHEYQLPVAGTAHDLAVFSGHFGDAVLHGYISIDTAGCQPVPGERGRRRDGARSAGQRASRLIGAGAAGRLSTPIPDVPIAVLYAARSMFRRKARGI